MGITNGIATIPGLLSPSVVGALTDGNVRKIYVYIYYKIVQKVQKAQIKIGYNIRLLNKVSECMQ